ncbi:hypothetical protein BFR47_05145 [Oceanisphaera psychrotolerans]|uniref:Uncharacterized protein n=1 Tax=Oceanisphaera psychrotolerans TaxID=1414654 RepID=A0A1J4QDI6_9GAMM|nr:hypothetical protein BFR47_05145 [Oceanisphaera psychrotolerans]
MINRPGDTRANDEKDSLAVATEYQVLAAWYFNGDNALKMLNRISLAVALLCVAIGTAVSIMGIWGFIGDTGLIWRSLATLGVMFLACIFTVAVNNMIDSKSSGK